MSSVRPHFDLENLHSGGWCSRCGLQHFLPAQPVLADCRELMAHLEEQGRIDNIAGQGEAACDCATKGLFTPGGGKMFGMLACRDRAGRRVVLRGFSGQFNGLWRVPGWVGPIFDEVRFQQLVRLPERRIKAMGRELATLVPDSSRHRLLKQQRRQLSRQLMNEIHQLYTLTNFRGEAVTLVEAFQGKGTPPAGTGDCCGPKLLNHAALNGLWPEAMAEFYWGGANSSGTKQHAQWYPACAHKCQSILGFQLCGL
nr:hypothetical protein [uncultured Desulfobulbus sp.]